MRRLLRKHWPILGICVLLIVLGLYLIAASDRVSEEALTTDTTLEEGLRLENIHYTQDNADKGMKWTLDAEEVRFSKNREFFSFMKFRLKLEREDGPCVVLQGKRGNYDKNSGRINLHGDLQASTNNGYRIITDHLLYKQKEGYIETQGPVRILGPFFSLAGRGLYFNPEKETLKIISDVTTHINGDSVIL